MIVRPLSTVDNTRDYARVSHSRQWSNCNLNRLCVEHPCRISGKSDLKEISTTDKRTNLLSRGTRVPASNGYPKVTGTRVAFYGSPIATAVIGLGLYTSCSLSGFVAGDLYCAAGCRQWTDHSV